MLDLTARHLDARGILLDRDPLGELADPGGVVGRVVVVPRADRNALGHVGDSVRQTELFLLLTDGLDWQLSPSTTAT
jgi:hypothetical protein